jgi:predicted metalloendopeptidase
MNITKKNKSNNNKSNKSNKTKKRNENPNRNIIQPFENRIEKMFKGFSSTEYHLEKEILKNLKKAVSPSKITPQDDFYSYVNERWLKDYKVEKSQKYIVEVDNFRIVQDKVFRELLEIVKSFVQTNSTPFAKSLKNFYEASKLRNTQQQSQHYSTYMLNKIDELRENPNNLWKLMGLLNYNEIISAGCPFVWSLNPDDKNPKIYRCYIESPQLTLIDLSVYFNDGKEVEYKRKYIHKYLDYLDKLFINSFGSNHSFNVKDVFDCEVKILNSFNCIISSNNAFDETYNVIYNGDLNKIGFDWKEFAHELGFTYTPPFFITSNVNYILCMTQLLLKEWNNEQWRTYWIYIYIRQLQRFNSIGHEIYYDFHGKFVRGQEEKVDLTLLPIYALGFAYNSFLTNQYIEKYNDVQSIEYVKSMATDLKIVFIRIIKRNKWLQPNTKKKAIEKLKKLKLLVGSPTISREDPILDYSNNDIWGNFLKISVWRHENAIILEGKPKIDIPVMDWTSIPPKFIGSQAYIVNAYYTPSENSIYIPLAYIQKPFIDLEERGIEYNLAHVGFTIAHELSHALDDLGSQYDSDGKLENWWSEMDKQRFKEIQKDVITQYETFASYDGISFNAEPSIGEDLADISGLTICREYLRDFQLKNNDILPIQRLSFEVFFVYFAFQQRQKLSKKSLESQLKINPHPPDKYRTNVPLSRLDLFRTIYNIKKGDKMWWHSTNKVWN